jgi:hypothetical protein
VLSARFNSDGDTNSGGAAMLSLKTHEGGMGRDGTRRAEERHDVRLKEGSEDVTHREQTLDFQSGSIMSGGTNPTRSWYPCCAWELFYDRHALCDRRSSIHAWDTRCSSNRSLVAWIFRVSRYHGIHPHRPRCGNRAACHPFVEWPKHHGLNGRRSRRECSGQKRCRRRDGWSLRLWNIRKSVREAGRLLTASSEPRPA